MASGAHARPFARDGCLEDPLFVVDLNGDNVADQVFVSTYLDLSNPGFGSVTVMSGSTEEPMYEIASDDATDFFGYAVLAANLHGNGSMSLVIAAPRSEIDASSTGRVRIYSAANGLFVRELACPANSVIGVGLAAVPDQDHDGATDVLVEGAALVGTAWQTRSFLYSGYTGRLLAVREHSIAALKQYADEGGRLYLTSDLNDDGSVDSLDVFMLIPLLGTAPGQDQHGDVNRDGAIDAVDLVMVLDHCLAGERTVVLSGFVPQGEASAATAARWSSAFPDRQLGGPAAPPSGGGGPLSGGGGANDDCGCGGTFVGGDPDDTHCYALLFGCPLSPVHLGTTIDLSAIGGSTNGGACSWQIIGDEGIVEVTGYDEARLQLLTVAYGEVTIRIVCSSGSCCACAQCTIRVVPWEEESCDVSVAIPNCPTSAQPPESGFALQAVGTPPGGFFRWSIVGGSGTVIERMLSGGGTAFITTGNVAGAGTVLVEYMMGPICTASALCTFSTFADSDRDGLSDGEEWELGTNSAEADTDGDGLPDGAEVSCGGDPLDPDAGPPGLYDDGDRDGLSDYEESCVHRTNPAQFDTDIDDIQDLTELRVGLNPLYGFTNGTYDREDPLLAAADRDRDFVFDEFERQVGLDPGNPDMDGDGIRDGIELADRTDPLTNHHSESPDFDNDGLCDYEETYFYSTNPIWFDSDDDGLPDFFEVRAGLNPARPYVDDMPDMSDGRTDPDLDGLNCSEEFIEGSDPLVPDTDGDGAPDGVEVSQGSSPVDRTDNGIAPHLSETCTLVMILGPIDGEADKLCERYSMHVGPFTLRSSGHGTPYIYRRIVRRGQCYPIQIVHRARRPGCPVHYNYAAYVGVEGCCSNLSDPDELLAVRPWSTEDRTQGLRAEICLPFVDLDIDSDNTAGLGGAPNGTNLEETAEAQPSGIKVVVVNRDDTDNDRVLDYADGLNADGVAGTSDDIASARFTPITLRVAGLPTADLSGAAVTFVYDAADPANVTLTTRELPGVEDPAGRSFKEFAAGSGMLRVWRKPGDEARSQADFIAPGAAHSLASLSPLGETTTLYVEAVNGSATSTPITVVVNSPCLSPVQVRVLPLDPIYGVEEPDIAGFTIVHGISSEITGTSGNDIILGQNNEPDTLESIYGLEGNDIIIPGDGKDEIHCGPGHDLVFSWRGSKDIYLDPGDDSVSHIAGNVLGATYLTNVQTEPPTKTPPSSPPPSASAGAPFTAEAVENVYRWAFGDADHILRAFKSPIAGNGEIKVVPSFSMWPSWITGTWDFERQHIESESTPGHPVVSKCVVKIAYSAGDPMSAALAVRNAILSEMPPRLFDEYLHSGIMGDETWRDPLEFENAYQNSIEMKNAQLQNVISLTLTLTQVYISVWFSAAGPAGEAIDAIVNIEDTVGDAAAAAFAAFRFLSELPGKALTRENDFESDSSNYFLDHLVPPDQPPGILPPYGGDDDERGEGPEQLIPARLWAAIYWAGDAAHLAQDVARIRIGNDTVSNIGFVLRKGMNVDRLPRANGSPGALIVGTAQDVLLHASGLSSTHARTINNVVGELARNGRIAAITTMPTRNYVYIGMNRSVRTMVANAAEGTRFESCSRLRPDIVAVWRDANGNIGVDMFEVRSGGQLRGPLLNVLQSIRDDLPAGVVRGVIDVLELEP